MTRSLAPLVALSLASCAPYLSLTTPAPPSATLLLDSEPDRIQLSQGVAGAFVVDCPWWCDRAGMRASSDKPAVAEVRPAHLGSLEWTDGVRTNTPAFAVVGIAPGHATLRLTDGHWVRDYSVAVLPR
jgi:hypothetical protein